MKSLHSAFEMISNWDLAVQSLYDKASKVKLKSYQYKNILKEQQGKDLKIKESDRYIQMIQKGQYDELVTELMDHNLELNDKAEKQGADFKFYVYFLLIIFDIFGPISYAEATQFVSELRTDFKIGDKKYKQYLKNMLGVNLRKRYLRFSHQRDPSLSNSTFKNVDKLIVQILLLGFCEDYATLRSLHHNPCISEFHKS